MLLLFVECFRLGIRQDFRVQSAGHDLPGAVFPNPLDGPAFGAYLPGLKAITASKFRHSCPLAEMFYLAINKP